jgi:hypothetical protein
MDNLQVSFTEETFDGLFQKATDIFETEDSADVDDQLLKGLAAHLPQLLEEKLYAEAGLSNEDSFSEMSKVHMQVVVDWVADLDSAEASAILASFSHELQVDVLDKMPDIKARRIKSRKIEITADSYVLKADLVNYIRDMSSKQAKLESYNDVA